jgi:DNA (cytosine-5)-methyltransferase 1
MPTYYNEIDPFAAQWLRNLIKAGAIADGDVDERDIRDVTPGELVGYSQCHFFAGIGGWSRALRLAGWPDDRPVWTGSCPCQSFSTAGRGKGVADERHLWPHWFHLIRECRPSVIIGEQVASKLALSWLDLVFDDLEGEGYAVGAADLCAASVGAFHIRQRLWFIAKLGNPSSKRLEEQIIGQVDVESKQSSPTGLVAHASGRREQRRGISGFRESDSPVLEPGTEQRFERGGSLDRMADAESRGTLSAEQSEQGDGLEQSSKSNFWSAAVWLPCRDGKWRPVEPGLCPLSSGLPVDLGCLCPGEVSPYRVIKDKEGRSIGQSPWRVGMLKGYGNSIVPEVGAEFIKVFIEGKNG